MVYPAKGPGISVGEKELEKAARLGSEADRSVCGDALDQGAADRAEQKRELEDRWGGTTAEELEVVQGTTPE